MAFTAVTDDIPVEPGAGALLFKANGTITKGQTVSMQDDSTVHAGVSGERLIGVAAYTVTTGNPVAIYGPGNKVACKLSGAVPVGTLLGNQDGGYLFATNTATMKAAICTKAVAATGDGEVLLY